MAIILSWSYLLNVILTIVSVASAYRPVQHCKQLGDNGHYSACTSLTQHYNQTSGQSDLFIRYHWYKYKDSKNGWHSFAIGKMMAGSLMFIMYGDPTRPIPEMTISVRSSEGHQIPQMIADMPEFNIPKAKGRVPEVDIVTNTFKPYTGPYEHPALHLKPSHVGIAEFIVRSYARWIGTEVSNTTTSQAMLWSSRYDQDFQDDYSVDRGIEMHAFGLGFGFIYADLLNAETSVPMFGPINELAGHKGIVEIGEVTPPTAAELATGEHAIANAYLDPVNADLSKAKSDGEHNPFSDHTNTTPSTRPDSEKEGTPQNEPVASGNEQSTSEDNISQKAYTIRGKTLRDWMWHLHGLLMSLSFFLLYPLGVYLLRSTKQITAGTSFNHHWTVQALATVSFAIACYIGYLQSRSISVTHQFVGIAVAFAIGVQMVLGWRHHIKFLQFKRKTVLSRIHVGLGRVILPLGFINILSGMKLRQYGWFTMLLVLALIVIEVVFGAVYLRGAHVRRSKMGGAGVAEELKAQGPGKDDDAEEYFQLAGDDDDDESDDDEGEAENSAAQRLATKRAENERLAKLDRV